MALRAHGVPTLGDARIIPGSGPSRGGWVMLGAPHRLAQRMEERFSELESEFHRAYWESQVNANPDSERRRSEAELALRRVKGDREAYEAVKEALEEPLQEAVLRRPLEVLRRSLEGNQMHEEQRTRLVELASSIESDFASFRPRVDGRVLSDNDVDAILKSSNDEEPRRRAWEASKEIGGVVADRVRELARLRNEIARELGFADHYSLALHLQEIDEEWLFATLRQLESLTEEPFRRWKAELDEGLRARFGADPLHPWHYSDPFFQQLPAEGGISLDESLGGADAVRLTQQTFMRWDIDLANVLQRSDLYPRERKCQHAFCLDVDRTGEDVRILANVVPGERWTEVMLHESGHAAYDVGIDPGLPYLLHRPAHTFVTEAVAILSGRLARDPVWLRDVAELRHGEIAALERELRRANAEQSLLFARWGLVMAHFERELYADPESDLDTRWWELVERFQLVRPPAGRAAPDWAAKIHIAVAPVYYHNYLLGEILASQRRSTCERLAGGFVGVHDAG